MFLKSKGFLRNAGHWKKHGFETPCVRAMLHFFHSARKFSKITTFIARLLRALYRAILSNFSKPENVSKPCFFQCPAFLKNPLLFKNIPCCSSNPRHMQKHCLKGLESVQQYRSSRTKTV